MHNMRPAGQMCSAVAFYLARKTQISSIQLVCFKKHIQSRLKQIDFWLRIRFNFRVRTSTLDKAQAYIFDVSDESPFFGHDLFLVQLSGLHFLEEISLILSTFAHHLKLGLFLLFG